MMPENNELEVRFAFNSYCRRTLKNEAINAHQTLNRQKQLIQSFSDLAVDEEYLCINRDPFDVIPEYLIDGIWISDELLKAGINKLPAHLKQIIHLYYFEELNDRKISEITDVPRSTVQNWRATALAKLKHDLEVNADVW